MSWKKEYGYYKISLGLFVLIFYFCKNPFVNRFDLLSFSIENFILFPNYVLLIFYILFFIDKNKIQDTSNSYRIDDQMIIDCLNNFHKYVSIKLHGKWWIVNRIYIYIYKCYIFSENHINKVWVNIFCSSLRKKN